MVRTPIVSALLLGALLPAAAQEFTGNFQLEGRYSTGKKTTIELAIRQAGNELRVDRVARISGTSPAGPFTWTCERARKVSPRVLRATYRLEPQGGLSSALASLSPGASDEELGAALRRTNVFEALYVISADGAALREVVVNTTRFGTERWSQINARGGRQVAAPLTPLSPAALQKKVEAALKRWHARYTGDVYEALLADASPAERPALLQQKARDLDFFNCTVSAGDDLLQESIEERYADGEAFLRQDGSKVELAQVRTYSLSFFPEHAGIGLGKGFAFDAVTGELLEEGELTD